MDKLEPVKYSINSIKSCHNLTLIFNFVYEKEKLKLIIYNKELQNKLNVNIEDYKNLSRKYKVGERNGFGREYELETNKLIFEGEYSNGKKNGKGKEYLFEKLIFEGEYSNGKKNGKGKSYTTEGKLLFEGEYLNGKEWNGKFHEYFYSDKLKFEGEYLNGKVWSGKGYNSKGNIEF